MAAPACATPAIKVFLADPSRLVRSRVRSLLEGRSIAVVGEGATPGDCIEGVPARGPDVVVLEVQLEGGSGLEVLKALHAPYPAIAFVVFSNHAAPAYRRRYLREGALHFLDKSTEPDRLVQCIATAACARPAAT